MGNCMTGIPGRSSRDHDAISKVTPFQKDELAVLKGTGGIGGLEGSHRPLGELENSVTLHRQHTAKRHMSKILE